MTPPDDRLRPDKKKTLDVYAYLGHQLAAGGTDRLHLRLEALGAHREALAFVELVFRDALLALLAGEVLRVPALVQRFQHLVLDLLLATETDSGLDTSDESGKERKIGEGLETYRDV